VVQLCQQLNGLPLALELAATRIKLLPLQVLMERLSAHKLDLLSGSANNVPRRQRTLRNTLDWSYNLLGPAEQELFRVLGIFRSSFSIEAVQAICSEVLAGQFTGAAQVLDRLGVLLDASLILQAQPNELSCGFSLPGNNLVISARFKLLETIREYALEQLGRQGELARLQMAQFQYYLQLIRNLDKQFNGPDQVLWFNILDNEYSNIRTAVDAVLSRIEKDGLAEQTQAVLDGLEFCRRITVYWEMRGYEKEGLTITKHFLESARSAGLSGSENYAWSLSRVGEMIGRLGDVEQAQTILEESLRLHTALGDELGRANVLISQGSYAFLRGDFARARQLYLQGEEISRQFSNKRYLGGVLISLAHLEQVLGNLERAYDLFQESLAIFQQEGNKRMIAECLSKLGIVAEQRQDYDTALIYYNKNLQFVRTQADYRDMASIFHSLANVFYLRGDYCGAYSNLVESLRLSYRIGDKYQVGLSLALLAILNVTKFEADLVENVADERKHYLERAAQLMGSSEAQFKTVQIVVMDRVYKNLYEEKVQTARAWLGEGEFSFNFLKGQALPLALPVEYSDLPAPWLLMEG
jgi:tetratricopeptide (TPR) repeat protein